MCGIAGIISNNKNSVSFHTIKTMTDSITHRGPDGDGHWIDENNNVVLGHRRLSIIDLSSAGSQPMHYSDRYTITFNGEIYNYLEIKDYLLQKGYKFKSESDTEVLMAFYDLKREKCLDDLDGMFAFAIWDKKEKTLFCARDRFGEKPFYYYKTDESFYFASEMKALWALGIPKNTNNRMLFNYWHFDSVFNPEDLSETFYQNIFSLEPSHYLIVNINAKVIKKQRYWDIDFTQQNNEISHEDANERFSELFHTSVKRRLRSDVPVGSSLSGGLDSSSIVCVIDKIKKKNTKQKTFSARFPNFIKDESKYLDIVLSYVQAEGYSCFPTNESLENNFTKIVYHQEEPFGSMSIGAQYEVMQLAKENDTIVLLDGQGADEYLCGYYGLIDSFFFELKKTNPAEYKKQISAYKKVQSTNNINNLSRRLRNNLIKENLTNNQINMLLGYKSCISKHFKKDIKEDLFNTYHKEQFNKKYKADTLNELLYYATFCGGLQELLRYADRNSMAHSREIRLPFLSHELVEFVFALPATFKVNDGFSKYILRSSMNDIVPKEIIWRKDKIGFEPPNKNTIYNQPLKNYFIK